MRIAVIGAGIIGVTTAYELAADGHDVTVFERRQAVASEASFANAGVVAAGDVSPWAAPWMPMKVAADQFSQHPAVHVGLGALSRPGWMMKYLMACRSAVHVANRRRMQRLALYSRDRLDALTLVHGLQYDQRRGYLVLLRGERELERAKNGLALLTELGVSHQLLDAPGVRACEPGLAPEAPLQAGLWLPNDLVGSDNDVRSLLRKTSALITVTVSGIDTDTMLLLMNAEAPIDVSPTGSETDCTSLLRKALASITVIVLGKVTVVRELPMNAAEPTDVTPTGIETDVKPLLRNASMPIEVTA